MSRGPARSDRSRAGLAPCPVPGVGRARLLRRRYRNRPESATQDESGRFALCPPLRRPTHIDTSDLPFIPSSEELWASSFIWAILVDNRNGNRLHEAAGSMQGLTPGDPEMRALRRIQVMLTALFLIGAAAVSARGLGRAVA